MATNWRAWAGATAVAVGVVAATAAGVGALYARAQAEAPAEPPAPTPVETVALRMQDGYAATVRLIGRVEPARETAAAFERGGLVEAVLVEEGDAVRRDQPLARLDASALELERARLQASLAAVEANLALARSTLERRAALTRQGHASGQAMDEARFAEAALVAEARQTEAALAAVELEIRKSVVRAPFDAVVAERMIDEGAVVAQGAGLARLQETGRPRARVGAPLTIARSLAAGSGVTLHAPSGPVAATLAAALPDVDPATRTVALLFDVDQTATVAMGDVVRLDVTTTQPGRGAWAPLTALREGLRGLWAITLVDARPDQLVAVETAVEVLHVADGRAFVSGPFADGALAVAAGSERLAPGQRVKQAERLR